MAGAALRHSRAERLLQNAQALLRRLRLPHLRLDRARQRSPQGVEGDDLIVQFIRGLRDEPKRSARLEMNSTCGEGLRCIELDTFGSRSSNRRGGTPTGVARKHHVDR